MNLDRVIAVRNTKTVYRDGDRCIKVFDEHYSAADVLNEALNQVRVGETALRIPHFYEVTQIDGKWAIVMEYIRGKTMDRLIREHPEKKDEYIDLLVELQMQVHAQVCPMLVRLKDKMHSKISQAALDATTRYDLHMRLESAPKHNKVCHGDFNPSNIILTEDGTPYILDWSHVTQGNASVDAAITYLCYRLTGNINDADAYLERFCQKTGIPKQYVQDWMPVAAASRSVKGNCREREFLLSRVGAADY